VEELEHLDFLLRGGEAAFGLIVKRKEGNPREGEGSEGKDQLD
jgi:hypothetical protein